MAAGLAPSGLLTIRPVINTYLLTASDEEGFSQLLQLRVLGLGLLQDGHVGIGIFPESEEILICDTCFGRVALHGVSASEADSGQCSPGKVRHQSPVVDELLKFCRRRVAVAQ